MQRLFVAGPGSDSGGTPAAFRTARDQLEAAGYKTDTGFYVFTGPFRLDDWWPLASVDLANCEGVALLDGWDRSPGTRREVDYATARGILCRSVDWWLRHRGSSTPCDCNDE